MDAVTSEPVPEARVRRRSMVGRLLRVLLGLVAALLALVAIAFWAVDTGPGRRLVADQIAALAPKSGLRIRVGRIDGSLWGTARLRDFRLYDTRGLFLEAPEVLLDWRPRAWLDNRLHINRLTSRLAILHRLPVLRPTGRSGPILPGFDLHIGRLHVERVRIEPAVAGTRRIGRLEGSADIRGQRALIRLGAAVGSSGDRLRLLLDAEPDRDRFDIDGALEAPAGGVLGKMLGTARSLSVWIDGDGRWSAWRGRAHADLSGRRIAALALQAKSGTYTLSGALAPSPFLKGKLQRLAAPRIRVTGASTLEDRRLDARLSLRSAALAIDAAGVIDLAESGFDGLRINAHLLRPPALFPNMTGRNVRLSATIDGPFRTAAFDYALTAPRVAFDATGFEDVRARGRGRLSNSPVRVPVRLAARRVTGVGDVAGGILSNLAVDGELRVTPKLLTGDGLRLTSDKLNGKLSLVVDLVTGRYDVTISGQLTRYFIPGLGLVDVLTELKALPGLNGRGTRVEGRGRAWVRRFDNGFLRSLAGGLPNIDTRLIRRPDGVVEFEGLRLRGPTISIDGRGLRRRDGTFLFEGNGRQGQYGPFRIALDGQIDRPKLDLLFQRPADALGLTNVRLNLDPNAKGFAYRAVGGSHLGPFTSNGLILLPPGQPAMIAVSALDAAGVSGSGGLRADPGGFTGALDLTGSLAGRLLFNPVGEVQRIEGHLAVNDAQFGPPAQLSVRRGKIDGVLLLDPDGLVVDGTVTAQGMRRGGLSLARLAAGVQLRGDAGEIKIAAAGSRRHAFDIQAVAKLSAGQMLISGGGSVEGRRLVVPEPARLTREVGGWRLAPTHLVFGGGQARVSGLFGASGNEIDAALTAMPLSLLDIAYPQLGLGGSATGKLSYRIPRGGSLPVGRADLIVRGMTRSGLVLSSRPVDVGIAAVLTEERLVARAVAASGGRTVGRAQARIGALDREGDILARIARAPVFAQLRYDGPVDTLWRLAGMETIDLSGPVAIGADIVGHVNDPVIRGRLRTSGARLESATLGTVITGISASGSFDGSRLVINDFAGATPRKGSVSGRASIDLASARGYPMDIALDARAAPLLNRDDISATVTGPISIRSEGGEGMISGNVTLERGSFRLGRAAVASVPRLNVVEVNRPLSEEAEPRRRQVWRLDLKAQGDDRLAVTGLGLDSEWRADLDIGGTVENPVVNGRADLVRGNYEFAGRRFELDRGAIRFQGETPPDPTLDIVARADLQGLDATIRVSGTGLKPEIDFASVPAMPEDELLSRLLFGTSITNLSAPEALQLAAAVASLRSGGGTDLNPINAVRRAAGLDRLRILPADVQTGQGTAIAAGKYLGRRTYLEVITDGRGYSATRIEFQITRWLSLLSTISTIGRQSVNVRVSKDY